jgi:dihydrodipicolinate synthase/N-acetylneuraminate lyase
MDSKRFFGVVPAMATPFTADETIDEARFAELIEVVDRIMEEEQGPARVARSA